MSECNAQLSLYTSYLNRLDGDIVQIMSGQVQNEDLKMKSFVVCSGSVLYQWFEHNTG